MRLVSEINIILISLTCAYGWNLRPPNKLISSVRDNGSNNLSAPFSMHWLKQPLDHFDPKENGTFDMVYYKRLSGYWIPNGPIYLLLTDIGHPVYLRLNSLTRILARATNGSIFTSAPRYYGDSVSMNLTHDKDYFKYLNTTQQLADIANLIRHIKSEDGFGKSKVVVLGFNNGELWATWMRLMYPDLVDVAVATEPALLAKKDFKEYFAEVSSALEKYGPPDCVDKMNNYYKRIGELLKNATGVEILKKEFPFICDIDNFTMEIDRQLFMYYHYRLAAWGALGGKSGIEFFCNKIPNEVIKTDVSASDDTGCIEFHLENISADIWEGSGAWYQICAEYGQFRTTDSEKPPFVDWNPLKFYIQFCKGLFGIDEKQIDDGIAETNRIFGGNTPNVTNAVFTYGNTDPARLLGVQHNLSDTVLSFTVEGNSANIQFQDPNESKNITETRNLIISIIKKWVAP